MADNLAPERRAHAMRRVKGKDTSPELCVRRLLRELGQSGYRLHRADIPGKPDIAWPGRRLALFVHGCFWHGHDCPRGARMPQTRREYWAGKIDRNRRRDAQHRERLAELGWRVLVVWECELRDPTALSNKLLNFLAADPRP